MQTRIKHRLETLERSVRLAREHPTGLARVTQLIDQIEVIIAQIWSHAGGQHTGHLAYRGGAATRAFRAAELLELMRSVNRIGRAVSPLEYPGLREQLRMPRGDGYRRLIAAAGSFIQVARAYKAVFLDRGLDPDFIEQIEAKIPELEAASTVINHGKAQRIGSTAGLADLARRGMEGLRELDAILSHQFRHNPALLASWKGAARVQRDAVRTHDNTSPSTESSATPAGSPHSNFESFIPVSFGAPQSPPIAPHSRFPVWLAAETPG